MRNSTRAPRGEQMLELPSSLDLAAATLLKISELTASSTRLLGGRSRSRHRRHGVAWRQLVRPGKRSRGVNQHEVRHRRMPVSARQGEKAVHRLPRAPIPWPTVRGSSPSAQNRALAPSSRSGFSPLLRHSAARRDQWRIGPATPPARVPLLGSVLVAPGGYCDASPRRLTVSRRAGPRRCGQASSHTLTFLLFLSSRRRIPVAEELAPISQGRVAGGDLPSSGWARNPSAIRRLL